MMMSLTNKIKKSKPSPDMMRYDSSLDDLGEDGELFSPSKEQRNDLEQYVKKRYINPLEEWRQKTQQNGTVPLYLRAGAKKPVPDRVTVYYNHEAAKKMAHDKSLEAKKVFKLPETLEENKTLPT